MIGQSVGSDASPLSCFLFRPRKSRKSAGNAVIPTFPTHWSHGLQHLRHKRRNVRFKGLRRVVHTPPQPLTAHTAAHTPKHGAFWMGALSLPSACAAWSGTSARAAVRRAYFAIFAWTEGMSERSREPSERRRALCASPFRGAAAPQGRAAPLLFLALHQ